MDRPIFTTNEKEDYDCATKVDELKALIYSLVPARGMLISAPLSKENHENLKKMFETEI